MKALGENLTLLAIGAVIAVFMLCVFYLRIPNDALVAGLRLGDLLAMLETGVFFALSAILLWIVVRDGRDAMLWNVLFAVVLAVQLLSRTSDRVLQAIVLAALLLDGLAGALIFARHFRRKGTT